jgi:CRISPR/Cas system-associated protein Cas7 (RAMP superfamily)
MVGFNDQLKIPKRNTKEKRIALFIKTLLHLYGSSLLSEEKNLLPHFVC